MPYNTGIPTGPQRLKDSQRPMRENFQSIQQAFSSDHVAIGALTNEGKHAIVRFPKQSPEPTAADANKIVMYSATYTTATGVTELYIRKNGALGIPFTAKNNGIDAGGTTVYWTFLPSGILLKYGKAVVTGTKTVNLNLTGQPSYSDTPYAEFSTLEAVTLVDVNFRATATTTTLTLAHAGGDPHTFSWLVIGIGDPTPTP